MLQTEGASLTTEHIKSHLQKYRLHYERSKEEFLGHYRKYLRLDRGDGTTARAGDEDADHDDRLPHHRAPVAAATLTALRDDTNADGDRTRRDREMTQLIRVQNLHNQLVHEQLELQSSLQARIHEQLQMQAELNELMRDCAAVFGNDTADTHQNSA